MECLLTRIADSWTIPTRPATLTPVWGRGLGSGKTGEEDGGDIHIQLAHVGLVKAYTVE